MRNSSKGVSNEAFLDCLRRAERFGWRYATKKDGVAYVEFEGGVVHCAKDEKELEMLLGLAD